MRRQKLYYYTFHVGHLEAGGVGFSAGVVATSKAKALAKLRESLGGAEDEYPCFELPHPFCDADGIRHFDLYFKPSSMSVKHIEMVAREDA